MKLVGFNVVWTVHQTVLPVDVVEEVAKENDLDISLLPRPTSKRAILRAAKDVSKTNGRFISDYVRKITDNVEKYSVGILHEDKDKENDQVEATQTTTVKYLKEFGLVEVSGEKAEEFNNAYENYKDGITDEEIRSYIVRIIRVEGYGIAVRPTGGVYFVPVNKEKTIDNLNKFLNTLGIGNLYPMRVFQGKNEETVVRQAVDHDIQRQLELLMNNVSSVTKRVKCLHQKREKMEDLEKMLKTYETVLGWENELETSLKAIKEADKMVSEKINELTVKKS